MDYRRFLPSESIAFRVNDHLVECGNTTWQIRNIAATSTGHRTLTVNDPEPRFEEVEPQLELKFKSIATWAVIAAIVGAGIGGRGLGVAAAVAAIGINIYLSVRHLGEAKGGWQAAKEEAARKWQVWDAMRKNPPVLYSLMLETNAGSKPLFYSFDEAQISKARDAINRAMERKETGDIAFNIETVNVGAEDSINNFGSQIYQQTVGSK